MTSSNSAAQVPVRGALGHVLEQLADKRVLLILDNCEHVINAAAEVAETLLGHCPGLRIVATSREPLAILGETLYAVPPLGLPAEGDTFFGSARGELDRRLASENHRPDHADRGLSHAGPANGEAGAGFAPGRATAPDISMSPLEYPAIRLFADRAAAVDPDFAVTAADLPDVLRICRRLDGLPLAIELAAARLRTLPVHQIANRLNDRFRLLTGGSRTAMPRHQTLRAVVAWSWDLLSPAESDLAERLAVFPGGVTAESAAAVLPEDAGYTEHEVFDLLSALVDKSLLQTVATEPDEPPRFRVLETIREFGAERLGERVREVRRAHARFFRDLAEEAEPHLRRSEQLYWIARLDRERDNILAALRFAADDGDADTAIRVAAAFAWYWTLGERASEGRLLMRLALNTSGDSPRDKYAIVRALERVTSVFEDELWTEAQTLERQLAEITRDLDGYDHPILTLASVIGPMLSDNQPALDAAVAAHLDHPDPWVRGMLLLMRGMSAENAGQRATVRADLEAARDEFARVGDRWGLSATINGLATLAITNGEDEEALALQAEALGLIQGINAFSDAAHIQMTQCMIMFRMGRKDEALALLQDILEAGRRSGSAMTIYSALVGFAEYHRLEGDTAAGWPYLEEAENEGAQIGNGPPQIMALRDVCAGLMHLLDGDVEASRTRLARSLEHGLVSHDMPVMSRVTVAVGCFADATGDPELAVRLVGLAEGLLGAADRSDVDRDRLVGKLRGSMAEDVFEACYTAGKTTAREEGRPLLARALGVPLDVQESEPSVDRFTSR
jgi:predicted ATPase